MNPDGGYLLSTGGRFRFMDEEGQLIGRSILYPREADNLETDDWGYIWYIQQSHINEEGEIVHVRIVDNNFMPDTTYKKVQFAKYDSAGNIRINTLLDLPEAPLLGLMLRLFKGQDGYYLFLSELPENLPSPYSFSPIDPLMVKLSEEGEVLWSRTYDRKFPSTAMDVVHHPGDQFSLIAYTDASDWQDRKVVVMRIDPTGELLLEQEIDFVYRWTNFLDADSEEDLLFLVKAESPTIEQPFTLYTMSPTGSITNQGSGRLARSYASKGHLIPSGNDVVFVEREGRVFTVSKILRDGRLAWSRTFRHPFLRGAAFSTAVENGYTLIGGKYWNSPFGQGAIDPGYSSFYAQTG